MAKLSGNVIGNLSGRLGNLSARTIAGKTILAARPSSFHVNYSPAVMAIRGKFHVTIELSKTILSLPTLAAIWQSKKDAGISAFNTICRKNFALSSAAQPTTDNIITPAGFSLHASAAAVESDKVTASISAMNTDAVFSEDEVNLSANAVVCFTDPVNPDEIPYQLIACSKEVPGFNFNQSYELQIDLDLKQQLIAAKYTKKVLLLSLASKNADGKVIQYSSTLPQAS